MEIYFLLYHYNTYIDFWLNYNYFHSIYNHFHYLKTCLCLWPVTHFEKPFVSFYSRWDCHSYAHSSSCLRTIYFVFYFCFIVCYYCYPTQPHMKLIFHDYFWAFFCFICRLNQLEDYWLILQFWRVDFHYLH